jgi:hypothetical protein
VSICTFTQQATKTQQGKLHAATEVKRQHHEQKVKSCNTKCEHGSWLGGGTQKRSNLKINAALATG